MACSKNMTIVEYCQNEGAKAGIGGCENYFPKGEGPQIAIETPD